MSANDRSLLAALDAVPLCLQEAETPGPRIGTLTIRICSPGELRLAADAALAGEGSRLLLPASGEDGMEAKVLIGAEEASLVCDGHGLARVTSDGTCAEVMVADPGGLPAGVLAASAVLAMIAERGYSPIHASLVERAGRAVMFCGERSRAKTSSCLALARAGWVVHVDDRCFMCVRDGVPAVWGPGGTVRLRADATELWPDLSKPMAEGRQWAGKRVVELSACGGRAAPGSVLSPALMFPTVAGSDQHHVEPMGRGDALGELLFSTGLATLPAHAAMQFRDLTTLLDRVACYRLRLGREMDSLPPLIAQVLA